MFISTLAMAYTTMFDITQCRGKSYNRTCFSRIVPLEKFASLVYSNSIKYLYAIGDFTRMLLSYAVCTTDVFH